MMKKMAECLIAFSINCEQYISEHDIVFRRIGMALSAALAIYIAYKNYSPEWSITGIAVVGLIIVCLLPLYGMLFVPLAMIPFALIASLANCVISPKYYAKKAAMITIYAISFFSAIVLLEKTCSGNTTHEHNDAEYRDYHDTEHYEPKW